MEGIEESIRLMRNAGVETERNAKVYSFGTFEECKKALSFYFQKLDTTPEVFQWLPEYNEIAEWMSDTKGKGLLFLGDCGRGKSTILLSVMPLMFFRKFNKIIHPFSSKELNMPDPKIGKITAGWQEIVKQWCISLDELGTEDKETNYLEPYEPFNKVIDDCEKYIKLLFLSSNNSEEELLTRYGERSFDRMIRLCKVIKFNGKSLRI